MTAGKPYHVDAVLREADGDAWPFEFGGETYTLPSDFDMRAAVALQANRIEDALRIMLGEEQWDRLCASPYVFGAKQLDDIMSAYTEALGIDVGESQASSGSSSSTPTPLKRTSRGTTKRTSRTSSKAG